MTSRIRNLVLDLVATSVFVLLGLHAHGHGNRLGTFAAVWSPFALGVIFAHASLRRWPVVDGGSIKGGVGIALVTVGTGMVIRAVSGQGTQAAFVLVALCFVTLFLTVWRFALSRIIRH